MVQAATTPTWAKPIPTYGATADPLAFPQRTLSCSYQPASHSHICPGLLPTTRTHVRMHMGARTRMLARRWTSLRLARPCGAPPALGRVGHRPMPFGHSIACWVLHAACPSIACCDAALRRRTSEVALAERSTACTDLRKESCAHGFGAADCRSGDPAWNCTALHGIAAGPDGNHRRRGSA